MNLITTNGKRFSFDGRVGVLAAPDVKPAILTVLISCKNKEDGFEARARAAAEKHGQVLEENITRNRMGGLEYRAKVRPQRKLNSLIIPSFTADQVAAAKVAKGIIEKKVEEKSSCMIG